MLCFCQPWFWFLSSLLILQSCNGFYLRDSYPHKYTVGDPLFVKVNSLTSILTQIPISYYSLPFCKPMEGVASSKGNLGEFLMRDRIEYSSPYRFLMHTNETEIFLCQTDSLSPGDFKILTSRIEEMYKVNLNLEDLPALRYAMRSRGGFPLRWRGYPVGIRVQDEYYVYNHLKFTVKIHDYGEETNLARVMETSHAVEMIPTVNKSSSDVPSYMVVGFEVVPCSYQHNENSVKKMNMYDKYPSPIRCDPSEVAMVAKQGQPLVFTYEVSFIESDIKWPSRWDAYLFAQGSRFQWFSFHNYGTVITFLAGIVLVIFLRTVRRHLTRYEELDKEALATQINEELSGWKLLVGDVFRAPNHRGLLCIMVGTGIQILGTGALTLLFAALGLTHPAYPGTLIIIIMCMLFFYLILGIAGGYVSVRLWRTIGCDDYKGWVRISFKTTFFFPSFGFLIFSTLNFLQLSSHSTTAIPFSQLLILILLWFCISVPLTLFGGYLGVKAPQIEYPVRRTNLIPREIPAKKYPSWLLALGTGSLVFGTLFIELFFLMSGVWFGRGYHTIGILFIVMILLVVVCAEASIVATYIHLCGEDWRWCWKSFFASGSVAIYIFFYSIYFLIFKLRGLGGPVSVTIYLGYSLLMVIAMMLATGTVGFLSSIWFVHYLFSSVKLD